MECSMRGHTAAPAAIDGRNCGHTRQIVAAGLEETRMSSIGNLRFIPTPLPRANIPAHAHRKGSHPRLDGDSGSDAAAQVPAATAQNLFGSLLHSLQQVIGLQSAATSQAPAAAQNPSVAGSRLSVKA
jgi:hypothetical protein